MHPLGSAVRQGCTAKNVSKRNIVGPGIAHGDEILRISVSLAIKAE